MTTIDIHEGDTVTRKMTRWHNPTDHVQRVTFITREAKVYYREFGGAGAEVRKVEPQQTKTYVIPPHGDQEIESIYDDAIQRIQGGVVIGGLAPLLLHPDRTDVRVHPCLVPPPDEEKLSLSRDDLVARLRGAPVGKKTEDPDAARVAKARKASK